MTHVLLHRCFTTSWSNIRQVNQPFSWPICPPFWGYCLAHSRVLRVSAPRSTTFQYCSCLYNEKFTVTTFRSRFSRFMICLESFTRADSGSKMADFGLPLSFDVRQSLLSGKKQTGRLTKKKEMELFKKSIYCNICLIIYSYIN